MAEPSIPENTGWVAIASGIVALLGVKELVQRFYARFFESEKLDAETERTAAEAEKVKAEAEAIKHDMETRRLQALKDAWSERVTDLTAEVHKLREEVISLRQAYDAQQKAHAEQMAAIQSAHAEQMAMLRADLEEARRHKGFGV